MDMKNVAKLNIPEGEVRTIRDKDGNLIWGKVGYGVKYKGDTVQNGTPTPSSPVAVQTVTGENVVKISDGQGNEQSYEVNLGKNLFDIAAASDVWINTSGVSQPNAYWKNSDFIKVDPNTTYTLSGSTIEGGHPTKQFQYHEYSSDNESSYINQYRQINNVNSVTFTTHTGCNYIRVGYRIDALKDIQFEKGSTASDYAAYFGPIELCKIGTYQDYIYKSGGKWYVHKEIGNISSYAGETISTDYISTTGSLTTGATIYYALATPTDTEIANEALAAQLEAVEQWLTRYGYNATVTGNLPIIIDRTAL